MTEAEKKKREKYDRDAAILTHSIAAQVAAVDNITYYGAFHILDSAKAILENEMKKQTPFVYARKKAFYPRRITEEGRGLVVGFATINA